MTNGFWADLQEKMAIFRQGGGWGKCKQKAVVAGAKELLGSIWAIGTKAGHAHQEVRRAA